MKRPISIVMTTVLLLLLTACGSDDDAPATTGTGRFVDGPVSGVRYQSTSFSGTTDSEGRFDYRIGETISFSYGGVILGSARGAAVITPQTMQRTFVRLDAYVNQLRFLQSLDVDQNHANGIELPDLSGITDLPRIVFDQTEAVFEASPSVRLFLRRASGDQGRVLISQAEALANFESALDDLGLNGDRDSDGVPDFADDFPSDEDEQFDTDYDGTGNRADTDDDGDSQPDVIDGFPLNASTSGQDSDSDGIPDLSDSDDDNDGHLDNRDDLPLDTSDWLDTDSDGLGNSLDSDDDNDGVSDAEDFFPYIASEWSNSDRDTLGDNEDSDDDNDGYLDLADDFPFDAADWLDSDDDGLGDNAEVALGSNVDEPDSDGDGRLDGVDNCPLVANPGQENQDGDTFGDICDTDRDGDGRSNDEELSLEMDPDSPDSDADSVLDGVDNCPAEDNLDQADLDEDDFGDVCDPDRDGDDVANDDDTFPDDATETIDTDGDGLGNSNADSDDDNDGLSDVDEAAKGSDPLRRHSDDDELSDNQDNCPALDNQDQADLDNDGVGDVCDSDRDGDGVSNDAEAALGTLPDNPDFDADGDLDGADNCPVDANSDQANLDGDALGNVCDEDRDGDGALNDAEAALGTLPDTPDFDGDGDLDGADNCPVVANSDQANLDGDMLGDVCDEDRDGDDVVNNEDVFPDDVTETLDADEDGEGNNADNCPMVANSDQANQDGDTLGDVCDEDRDGDGAANTIDMFPDDADENLDTDGDGFGNNSDNCPILSNSSQADANANEIGDACEMEGMEDHDGDGVPDATDNCPYVSNADQIVIEACGNVPNAVRDDVMLYAYAPHELDVLANDAFGLNGERAAPIQILTQPSHGEAVVDDNGTPSVQSDDTIWYTPQEGYVGVDELVYQISDTSGAIALGRVYLGVLFEFSDFTIDRNADTFKTLTFSWAGADLDYADHLTLLVSRDGVEAFAEVSGADDISSSENSVEVEIPVHLVDWINARYRIEARAADNQTIAFAELSLLEATRSSDHIGYIKADNVDAGDIFGASMALSGDGKTLAVGAELEDSDIPEGTSNAARGSGAVYVFANVDGQWVQQSYIKAENIDASDNFGRSLALSNNGNTLVVGAPKDDGMGNAVANAGAAYVFQRDEESSVWTQHAYLQASNLEGSDLFGSDVAISNDGTTIAISATQEDSDAVGVDGDQLSDDATNSGAVYVFTSNGDSWAQQAYLKASNTGEGDMFGGSVSLSADGDVLAVGAIHEDSSAGAVYLFAREAAAWSHTAYVKASNADTGDNFGRDVALSADGLTLVVGASGEDGNARGINGNQSSDAAENAGAAYIFHQSEGWEQTAYVKASNTESGNEFGYAVDVSDDGRFVAVSARLETGLSVGVDGNQTNYPSGNGGAGAVYTFLLSDEVWSQQRYLKASNTGVQDQFGSSLAVSDDADVLAVGARLEQSMATGIGGHQHNDLRNAAGAAYLY